MMQKRKTAMVKKYCQILGGLLLLMGATSCEKFFEKHSDKQPLARVGESYLYPSDLEPLIGDNMSEVDKATFVTGYINNWASKKLLLGKAKFNLSEDKLSEFDRLVENYQNDLYTRAYKEALVAQESDTLVTQEQLQEFYDIENENFRLKEKIVQLRFVEIPLQFLNKSEVVKSLKKFENDDKVFLDSLGVHFKKLNFNDSLWVPVDRVLSEIPPLLDKNESDYLKKSQFFELEDTNGVYLAKIKDVREPNDIAPLSYIKPTLKQVLLSRRRLGFIRNLETEIIDEAIKNKEFEVFTDDKK